MKTVAIITTGDEILHGTTVDTNSAYMSWHLFGTDLVVENHITVGDNIESIVSAVNTALVKDIVLITGGLGPTDDDNTVEAISKIFCRRIITDPVSENRMVSFFDSMKIRINSRDFKMASVPENARILKNNKGLAPGFIIEEEGKTLIALPGVPAEARSIFENEVLPFLHERFNYHTGNRILMKVTGIRESDINSKIDSLRLPESIIWGVSAKSGICELCFMSGNRDFPDKEEISLLLHESFEHYIIGEEFSSPDAELIHLLREKSLTISTAESCTGGLIGKRLTDIAGASDVFAGSVIAYSNSIKTGILGVGQRTINENGAVSLETASEMAVGIKRLFCTDIGVSVTGIAGPGGGTNDKPVGTVCFGFYINDLLVTKKEFFSGDRDRIRTMSALYAINFLRKFLLS